MSIGLQVWSQTASANSTIDTNINWPEGMAPSQVNDSARAMMASAAKWRDDNNGTIVTSGTTTAYTVTTSQVEAALTAGYTVAFQMHATNDSSATLAVDGLTAKPLQVITGTNLQGGELQIGNIYRATYSTTGTGQWLVNDVVQPGSQANIIGTTNISTNAVTYAKIQQAAASSIIANPTTSVANVQAITLGANLSFSGTTLVAGTNTPVVSVFTSTAAATWQTTTQNGSFPLYLLVRMVGGGGGGAAANTNSGSSGTDTSFSNWTAVGGAKGTINATPTSAPGGSGGTNGTGTLIRRLAGQNGQASAAAGLAGAGGNSALGGGGMPAGSGAGTAATANSGSGGSGSSAQGGGAGGEYVEFFVTSPATSYSYTVGAGGAGGTAGGTAGSSGAAGRIEVISLWQ